MIYKLSNAYFVRALLENDVNGAYPTWFQDAEVCQHNSHGKFLKTKDYFKAYIQASNQEDRVIWAICHIEDGHIGNVSLQEISFINRTAEFAILLGDKRHWGKGLGFLAGKQLLIHGFNKLNLKRIHCGTAATNQSMIKLAGALGMVHEGIRRQHLFLEGEWVDSVLYGVLREEFKAIL